jgi:hypothetical protein
MYVSRRLRVFEDNTLAPLVLADKLPVSTAEELLVVSDVSRRNDLAQQAVEERWERPQVRAAVRKCIAAIQPLPSAKQRSARLPELVEQLRRVLAAGPLNELTTEARATANALAADMLRLNSVSKHDPLGKRSTTGF